MSVVACSKYVPKVSLYLFLALGPQEFVYLLAIFEEDEGGCAHDVILGSGQGIPFYVHLPDLYLPGILMSQLVEYGIQGLTIGAQRRIVLHKDRPREGEHLFAERPICDLDRVIEPWNRLEGGMALPTYRVVVHQGLDYSIFRTAVGTLDDRGFRL
jgi:hypothetical protein